MAATGPSSSWHDDDHSSSSTLVVGNPASDCPHAHYPTIQSAVDAAPPGSLILVCPGTYPEQVTIPPPKYELTLRSLKPFKAIIQAPPVIPTDAIVHIQADRTKIQQFTIQGPGSGPCGTIQYGVFVDNARSATIEQNRIAHIRDEPLSGCQNGVGVQVGRAALGSVGTAVVRNNWIYDYQKNGVTVSNAGSSAVVECNIVQGAGPTSLIAQNGIQVSSDAKGTVRGNDVSGNVYTPQTVTSTGVLLFQPGPTAVAGNRVHANDTGIYAYGTGSGTSVVYNGTADSTFDGITLDSSTKTTISGNVSYYNDQGIGVYGLFPAVFTTLSTISSNRVAYNRSNGLFADMGTRDNTFKSNEARHDWLFDCRDDSVGTGTAGTANWWLYDRGDTSSPPGICKP